MRTQASVLFVFVFLAGCPAPEPLVKPDIKITDWPEYGQQDLAVVSGVATNVDFSQYGVAVYIQGRDTVWYPKSEFGAIALLDEQGYWEMTIVTHPNDVYAISILAMLVPFGTDLPTCWPELCLKMPQVAQSLDFDLVERPPVLPKISFSGYQWEICDSGPSQTPFSTSSEDVWVDQNGLHLTVSFRDGQWYSTQVASLDSFGYGTYHFQTRGRIDLLDPNVVFGMFTWDREAPESYHREMDIEFTRWGDLLNETNAQFVVHPCSECPGCDNCQRFFADLSRQTDSVMDHYIVWQPGSVEFSSYSGRNSELPVSSWQHNGDFVPIPGQEKVYLNLWLSQSAPVSELEHEIIITDFSFQPLD
jgi:hypothetical protein